MKLVEDRELDHVAGANTLQEAFDFVERVLRELHRIYDQPSETMSY